MKGREYREEEFVGLVDKDVETESGDKIGKVDDVAISKDTKKGVLKVSHGVMEKDEAIPIDEVVRVDEDNVIVSNEYAGERESDRGVRLR